MEVASTATIRRARKIDRLLTEEYPDARCELDFTNAFELLVATALSAQTTDVRVNQVTPELFERFPDPAALSAARLDDLEVILHPLGFFRAKAKSLSGMGRMLTDRFGGQVPRTASELVTLPGVGRKTALVVLGNAFGVPGITVDTHVGRVSRRLGLSSEQDAAKVERDLNQLFLRKDWTEVSHRLIFQGRRRCFARKPDCGACVIAHLCPSAEVP